ncbi:uncharacterized protein LOC128330468 [Hemicordylus capensis]|uniref:uncharacterized protein LOC128330468 n=1 Tax=Hemicordylus capensis TaxID=884348 RepID=UPI00230351C8|nr:uncharacterized protein LOC128330468 [Hemicordylus capensis]XP_053119403.1 uncharacterized protein LOC128330468 [Hemicordylus capensis]XP_053119404.1 uncharacterized protein LOC128330468 [Hemicordylus capensis]XP_053119405.1 uncharacterized protein LOC128330468 [Hemicordylus capensis]XP_053119406.1 uncharacterized protein LOC128330468 [Hemicordylus capensis]XP_053119407.1 uncharacterized protein LOC128330468 [Hemicordylus capensis]XP_053119408.1 uncharacterized protein LOC128330468 [Hemico
MAIMSQTPIGLRRALGLLSKFCSQESIEINYGKTKVLVFAKRPRQYCWSINGHRIAQVNLFKYLGVVFQSSGSRNAHLKSTLLTAQSTTNLITSFHFSRGASYIPAAVKLFVSKVHSQVLYGAQIGPVSNFMALETLQSKFLRSILLVPRCVPNAALRREVGMIRLETCYWRTIILFWLKFVFSCVGLAPLIKTDCFRFKWQTQIADKLAHYGFSQDEIIKLGYDRARIEIKQRIMDMELQEEVASLPKNIFLGDQIFNTKPASYLSLVTIPKFRRALTLARLNALPSAVMEGGFKGTPFSARLCPCGSGQVETIAHAILYCNFYRDTRLRLVSPLLQHFPGHLDDFYLKYLLSSSDDNLIIRMARYCHIICTIRSGF